MNTAANKIRRRRPLARNWNRTTWQAAPTGSVIGHVHPQVGDINQSGDFYRDEIGFAQMIEMPQASFYGSGGYHHHLAGNIWNSRNAGQHSEDNTGLIQFEWLATGQSSLNQNIQIHGGLN